MANILFFWPYPWEQEETACRIASLGHDVFLCGSFREFSEAFKEPSCQDRLSRVDLIVTAMQIEDAEDGGHIEQLRHDGIFQGKFAGTPVLATSSFGYSEEETKARGLDFVWEPAFHKLLPDLIGLYLNEESGRKGSAVLLSRASFLPEAPIRGGYFRTFPHNTNSAG